MSREAQSDRARRYLLGDVDEAECTAIELEYLRDPDALDRIAAAEDDLIEDYLDGGLTPEARHQFEQVYLATPAHRARVATIRRLATAAGKVAREQNGAASGIARKRRTEWLALAATAAFVVAGLWLFRPLVRPPATKSDSSRAAASSLSPKTAPVAPGVVASSKPNVVAVTISPLAVRGAADSPPLVVPPGTDAVSVLLEAETGAGPITRARATARAVGGSEIWRGVPGVNDLPPGVLARVDIPARLLTPDDYVIELTPADANGAEQQQSYQYFLRVRAR